MRTPDRATSPLLQHLLSRREAELRTALGDAPGEVDGGRTEAQPHEVLDFKEIAANDSISTVAQAQANRAREELELVVAARRRLADASYGLCLDCGEPIDPRRLAAAPSSSLCTECQAAREHEEALARRH